MTPPSKPPSLLYRLTRLLNPRMARNYRKGIGPTRAVLLLTTTGRRSGLPRVTPLQYEVDGGVYCVASARGPAADWFRNIQADPHVRVQVGPREFAALAEAVTCPQRIADFLELRLKRHPWMVGAIMRLEGLPLRCRRSDLERFAAGKAMAVLTPAPEPRQPDQLDDPLQVVRQGADDH